ncbi:hypothetical protein QUA35_23240, partial [Microcoleus sp. N9_B2]|uniref:hypothetical protein n=1 Tax=unclassified Microcoleus TaxID=2642155 RepID=UPI002FD4F81E
CHLIYQIFSAFWAISLLPPLNGYLFRPLHSIVYVRLKCNTENYYFNTGKNIENQDATED